MIIKLEFGEPFAFQHLFQVEFQIDGTTVPLRLTQNPELLPVGGYTPHKIGAIQIFLNDELRNDVSISIFLLEDTFAFEY